MCQMTCIQACKRIMSKANSIKPLHGTNKVINFFTVHIHTKASAGTSIFGTKLTQLMCSKDIINIFSHSGKNIYTQKVEK